MTGFRSYGAAVKRVMAGLVPAMTNILPSSFNSRDRRDKPGDAAPYDLNRPETALITQQGIPSMTTANDVLKLIKDNDVKYADFRFTDPRGKWQHVTFDISQIEEETFSEGMMFDGSSIAGWKAIHESDMCLMPDPNSVCIDPFFAETTLVLVCDVLEPTTGEPYSRDPRGIARRAEAMVKSLGIGDTVLFGPEAEFFVFDDV